MKIYNPPAACGVVMPDDEQLELLARIITAKHRWMAEVSGPGFFGAKEEREQDWQRQFSASFRVLGVFKRTERPNHKVYLSWHIAAAETYLRSIRQFETLRSGPFLAAALAHGDISYCCLEKHPELGLSEHVGREAGTAWKRC